MRYLVMSSMDAGVLAVSEHGWVIWLQLLCCMATCMFLAILVNIVFLGP